MHENSVRALVAREAVGYAIQLRNSPRPVRVEEIGALRLGRNMRVYSVRGVAGGRAMFGLRIGVFRALEDARRVLAIVRTKIPAAHVVDVDEDELRALIETERRRRRLRQLATRAAPAVAAHTSGPVPPRAAPASDGARRTRDAERGRDAEHGAEPGRAAPQPPCEPARDQLEKGVARALAQRSRRPGRAFAIVERVLYLGIAACLAWGFSARTEQFLTAETGLGYGLGIAGGSCMLALFLYPLRKRSRGRRIGSIKSWFRAHIVLGVIGPALILFHSGFGTGSLNDNVALFSMLLVAGSGLFGRYVYAHMHSSLRDRKATLEELRKDLTDVRGERAAVEPVARLNERLLAIEAEVLAAPATVWESAVRPLRLALKTRWDYLALKWFARRQLRHDARFSRLLAEHRRRLLRVAAAHVRERLRAVRRVAEYGFYERLFSRWHMFHYPLFFVLLVAAVIHVIAVHFY